MILSDAPETRTLRDRCGKQTAPNSNALTDGVTWLFEALRATDYYDERILRSHERLPMPERAQMARAYYHALPLYDQILIHRAALESPGSPHHQ
jgi:hypothetical protein